MYMYFYMKACNMYFTCTLKWMRVFLIILFCGKDLKNQS